MSDRITKPQAWTLAKVFSAVTVAELHASRCAADWRESGKGRKEALAYVFALESYLGELDRLYALQERFPQLGEFMAFAELKRRRVECIGIVNELESI